MRQWSTPEGSGDDVVRYGRCICAQSTSLSKKSWPALSGSYIRIKPSSRCRVHPFAPVETAVFVDVPFVRRVFSYSLQFCLSITRCAAGFYLTPELRAVRIVSNDAPIFKRTKLFMQDLKDVYYFKRKPVKKGLFDNFRREIYDLFCTRGASPWDVNERGETALMVKPIQSLSAVGIY